MVYGGIIAIFTAIWIYRTAIEAKTGNAVLWVAGSFVMYLALQMLIIYCNATIVEIFDRDISVEYDNAGGLNARDHSDTAGLQSGPFGTFIGVMFELATFIIPFFVVAIVRLKLMLKQPLSFPNLFGGIGSMFAAIGASFKNK